jgi:hypothetical protein
MQRDIFASVLAQHENLGDVLLRRQMVQYLGHHGRLHILGGSSPPDYVSCLNLPESAVIYASPGRWLTELARAAAHKRAVMVYSPGPQRLIDRPRILLSEGSRLLVTSLLRASGAPVIRLGRSFEGQSALMTRLARRHTSLLSLSVTRDGRLKGHHNSHTLPDIAVSAGDPSPDFAGDRLAVSLRFDRILDIPSFAKELSAVAEARGLQPTVVSQVTFDQERHDQLASLLGVSHVGTETRTSLRIASVTNAYRGSALVLSNRLHALVMGLTHGAVPWLLDTGREQKVESAMQELGMALSASPSDDLSELESADLGAERERWSYGLAEARERLSRLDDLLEQAAQN